MSIKFNDNIEILAPKHLDARYSVFESGESRPFNSVQEALDLIPRPIRAVGLSVLIRVDGELRDYWFVDKDTLEEKIGGGGPSYSFEYIDYADQESGLITI